VSLISQQQLYAENLELILKDDDEHIAQSPLNIEHNAEVL